MTKEKTALEASKEAHVVPSLIHLWKDIVLAGAHKAFEKNKVDKEKDAKIEKYEYIISKLTTQNDFL